MPQEYRKVEIEPQGSWLADGGPNTGVIRLMRMPPHPARNQCPVFSQLTGVTYMSKATEAFVFVSVKPSPKSEFLKIRQGMTKNKEWFDLDNLNVEALVYALAYKFAPSRSEEYIRDGYYEAFIHAYSKAIYESIKTRPIGDLTKLERIEEELGDEVFDKRKKGRAERDEQSKEVNDDGEDLSSFNVESFLSSEIMGLVDRMGPVAFEYLSQLAKAIVCKRSDLDPEMKVILDIIKEIVRAKERVPCKKEVKKIWFAQDQERSEDKLKRGLKLLGFSWLPTAVRGADVITGR